jgi:hypothetical protein
MPHTHGTCQGAGQHPAGDRHNLGCMTQHKQNEQRVGAEGLKYDQTIYAGVT